MGSEKRATAVGISDSTHSADGVLMSPSGRSRGSRSGAEQKRTMIRTRKKEKSLRKIDVKSSLDQFLAKSQSDESDGEIVEDDELISEDERQHRPSSSRSAGEMNQMMPKV